MADKVAELIDKLAEKIINATLRAGQGQSKVLAFSDDADEEVRYLLMPTANLRNASH